MEYKGHERTFESGPRLGGGGMADVYIGTAKDDGCTVAIKVPRADLPPEVDTEMFLREAASAAAIDHKNVVKLVDWGDGPPFIAFEYIQGTTLEQLIAERQATGQAIAVDIGLQYCRQLIAGLSAINEQLVHRDIKPGNVFIVDEVVKISDFGLAKYVDEATRRKTFKGWGSAPYIAPETIRGDTADWRADQYSLGILFFELMTMRRPFDGRGDELANQHLFERPTRATQIRPELPEAFATVVARMLEKRPSDRYQSWSDIDAALRSSDIAVADDSDTQRLVAAAAANLDDVRAKEQAARTKAEQEADARRYRQSLLTFWADDLYGRLQSRIDQLNQAIGETAIRYLRSDPSPLGMRSPSFSASFLNASLELSLEGVPPNANTDLVLWGGLTVKTNRRIWYGNLALLAEPEPYGEWLQIDLEMNPIIRDGARPEEEDRSGGQYEIVGAGRLVLARNWQGLVYQRQMKNVLSLVQYREQLLNFDALADEVLTVVVEDGGEGPATSSPRGDGW